VQAPSLQPPPPAPTIPRQHYLVYSGMTVSRGNQFLLGGRYDFGSFTPGWEMLRLVPELALGFGDGGTSTLIAGNMQFLFPRFKLGVPMRPFVEGGVGLLAISGDLDGRHGTTGVLNVGYGLTLDLTKTPGFGRPQLYLEHQGIDLYDLQRILIGLQWARR
jgi:hypothetical protein